MGVEQEATWTANQLIFNVAFPMCQALCMHSYFNPGIIYEAGAIIIFVHY